MNEEQVRSEFMKDPKQSFAIAFRLVQEAAAETNAEERIFVIQKVAREFGVDVSDCTFDEHA
ncbi:hypothetical protein [Paenibacillus sp. 1A_MP2]|uniref:hypothetical protein n=1 Tax=Paenibacillus sp. 1A_MP2 TaxID=3457495 RepID=UPI003FCE6078